MVSDRKRVLVVDDSVFARKIISDIVTASGQFELAGTAANGLDALDRVGSLAPDVVTLDVEMPGLNGVETLKRLMAEHPVPVVMVSSLTVRGARESITALSLGAVDVVAKPHGSHSIGLTAMRGELIDKLLAACESHVLRAAPTTAARPQRHSRGTLRLREDFPVVVIASSTGGPRALRSLVPELPTAGSEAYVVVQHLPPGFSGPLAEDLDKQTDLDVHEAAAGDVVRPGELLFARSGYHCIVERGGEIVLSTSPPLWGVRPSADITMVSAAETFGARVTGVVLTGMGRDGADGVRAIKAAGGRAVAEHECSCAVYGMPRAAAETGVLDAVAPLPDIAEAIASFTRRRAAA